MSAIVHVDDRRFIFPSQAQALAVPFEAVRDTIASSLKNAPVEITVVGAIDDRDALEVVNATFATLPNLPKAPRIASGGDVLKFPAAVQAVALTHKGRADQSLSVRVWPVPDYLSDTHTSAGLILLRDIPSRRMFDQIREKLGQAYDPNVVVSQSMWFKGYGLFQAGASVPAGQDAAFESALNAIIAELQNNPVSADELERVRKPVLEHHDNSRKENQYWLHLIAHGQDEPARLAAEEKFESEISSVTPVGVQILAKRYLVKDRAVHLKGARHSGEGPLTSTGINQPQDARRTPRPARCW